MGNQTVRWSEGLMIPEFSHSRIGLDQEEWVLEWAVILVLGEHKK